MAVKPVYASTAVATVLLLRFLFTWLSCLELVLAGSNQKRTLQIIGAGFFHLLAALVAGSLL